jgi:ketosteroid isomerase-like protein
MTSRNKKTVQMYMDAFNRLDRAAILSCLTDDVEWVFPGLYHHYGKEAFDREVANADGNGPPLITVSREIEEHDVVVAEGTVRAQLKGGDFIELAYCDVFEMRDGKIRKLTSYVLQVPSGAGAAGQAS